MIKEMLLECAIRSPQSLLFSWGNNLNCQIFLTEEVIQPSDHLRGPLLDLLQQVNVLPMLRPPELDAELQVWFHGSGAEREHHLPRPVGHISLDAAQAVVGSLVFERTLPVHVQPLIHQHPQVLLHRAILNSFIPQPVLNTRGFPDPGAALALSLVAPHEVPMRPLLELVLVPRDSIPSLRHKNCTTQLGTVCKLAEGALLGFLLQNGPLSREDLNT
ncbi:uncharacterized protein LOC109144966 [Corvus cornix cornix]|uniref:uncharacterized protein LOC109144966 n=1 Tax=Corvus cornix cornix TaxID=932674 RepID=UPI00194F2EB0|nr:uncharacterized protein LOC109144966 [Corvus cornix cornix]